MPLLGLDVAFIDHAKIPALRNALKACEEDRLNDALEIIHAAQGDLTPQLVATRDLYALIQERQGFVDGALANAIETFQKFPHLAIGYNRASELYMQKGQGLRATEVYEVGLRAIGEEGDPLQMSLLQKYRHKLELKYRDFIGRLPLQITERIFQEFDRDFRLSTCFEVSNAWLPKATYNVDGVSVDSVYHPPPVVLARLWKYIDTLDISLDNARYLVEFFCELSKEPSGGKCKRLKIVTNLQEGLVDLHKIMAPTLTKISQSLASLTVYLYELISPADLLAACPNLTVLDYSCSSCLASVQKTIPQRDKLTSLIIYISDPCQESFIGDLQSIIKATPNVRFAGIPAVTSDVLHVVPQHWRRLRKLYLDTIIKFPPEDQILEGEDFLDMWCAYSDLSVLYECICQEWMRLSSLVVRMGTTMPTKITPVQFHVLKYLNIDCCETDNSSQSTFLEVIRGAVATLEELVLEGTEVPPETYEVLARMPRLERLALDLSTCTGIGVYLEHLASLGASSPLKSISIHDWAFDDDLRTILATRIPTLKEIIIFTNTDDNLRGDTWILPLLEGLVQSKSEVEQITLLEYALTTEVLRALCNLSELRELDVVEFCYTGEEHHPRREDFGDLRSRIPQINIDVLRVYDPSE